MRRPLGPNAPRHLARLAMGETTVKELSEPFSISAPSITKHLKVLERAFDRTKP
jgi:DNA-binding transcriptional ArsR family regulator